MTQDDDDTTTAQHKIIHVLLSYDDVTHEEKAHLRDLRHAALTEADADWICAIVKRLLLE